MTWTAFLIATAIVAWLTAAATAVRSVSRIWLRHWVEKQLSGSASAVLYLERPQRMLLVAATGVSLTVFATGLAIGAAGRNSPMSLLVQALVFALLLLVAGQLVPRAVARRWPAALIPVLLPPLQILDKLLAPPLQLVRRLTGERAIDDAAPVITDDEALEELLREGELEGIGEHAEIAIISGVVQFSEKRIRDVLTPRAEVFALDESLSREAMANRVAQSGYSRVPVYRGSLDNVVGMVHVFDFLKDDGSELPRLRPVAFTSPGTSCKEVLFTMLRDRKHIAIVAEGGVTIGIVTLEDLLEELVGDIRDEHDEPAPVTAAAVRPA